MTWGVTAQRWVIVEVWEGLVVMVEGWRGTRRRSDWFRGGFKFSSSWHPPVVMDDLPIIQGWLCARWGCGLLKRGGGGDSGGMQWHIR